MHTAGRFGEVLGKQDGKERRMVGIAQTVVYLLQDVELENREQAGHYICKEDT